MGKIELRKETFAKAIDTLHEVLALPYSTIHRDAAIQRFEYTFEICWKLIKTYLFHVHGLICNSPKSCFREGFQIGLYDQEHSEKFLRMVDDRNMTTHVYNVELVGEIFKNIKDEYLTLFQELNAKIDFSSDKTFDKNYSNP